MRSFQQPRWDGSPLRGRTILLHAEQGLGDTLQFIRYAPLVKASGKGRVLVECQQRLADLIATCPGIDQVIGHGSPLPEFDVHAPLLSLPYIFSTDLGTIPANVPYLSADAERVKFWREELSPVQAFKVGIAWQGNPDHPSDRQRSAPLMQFMPLTQVEGVQLFSLQRGAGVEQLPAFRERCPITDLGKELTPGGRRPPPSRASTWSSRWTHPSLMPRRPGSAGVGGAVVRAGLALAAGTGGQSLVSQPAAIPADAARGVGAGFRAAGGGTEATPDAALSRKRPFRG